MRVTRLTKLLSWVAVASALVLGGQASAQTVLLNDNFDSYTAGQDLSVAAPQWVVVGTTASNLLADSTILPTVPAQSSPNFVYHGTTATRNQQSLAESGNISSTLGVRFSFDFYDVDSTVGAYRQHSNLQDGDLAAGAGTNQLVSMGLNNNILNSGSGGNFYFGRIVGYTTVAADPDGGPDNSLVGTTGWFKLNDFATSPLRSTGWHNLRVDVADFDANGVTDYQFYVDNILAEVVNNVGSAASVRSYDWVRLGSGLSSTQNAATDNIRVETFVLTPPASDNADFNNDNVVDGADFLQWQRNVSINDGSANLADGDANDDGNVDGADLAILETQFGTDPTPVVAAASAIPEPASLALAGLALVAGLAASRRRR